MATSKIQFQIVLTNSTPGVSWSGVNLTTEIDTTGEDSARTRFVQSFPVDNAGLCAVEQDIDGAVSGQVRVTVKSPGGDDIIQVTYAAGDLFDKRIALAVAYAPSTPAPAEATVVSRRSTLPGRILVRSGLREVNNVQFIIYCATASDAADGAFAPIFEGETEGKGYFYIPYSASRYSAAYALIGLPGAGRAPIVLVDVDEQGLGTLPDPLLLVVDITNVAESSAKDCGCQDLGFHDSKRILDEFTYHAVVRTTQPAELKSMVVDNDPDAVDMDDLVTAHPVLADLLSPVKPEPGGRHGLRAVDPAAPPAPARTKIKTDLLRNYLASAGALAMESLPTLIKRSQYGQIARALQRPRARPPGRNRLSATHAIDWDEDPTVYQAASVAHGHILTYRQEWIADGYSTGDLLYSLPLAPGQKKQIVIFDWERRESAKNQQQLDYEEALSNTLSYDRDVNEIARGSLSERMHGESEGETFGVGGGLGAAGSGSIGVLSVGASLGAAIGFGSSSSSATQTNSRDISTSNMQTVRDRLAQSASNIRSQRATVVQTVAQGERFSAQSETIANYNHCHAVTIQYFEVLRHFKVQQRLVDVQECLFIPLMMSPFDGDKALRWSNILKPRLRDRALAKGFDALERVATDWEHSDLPSTSFADENIVGLSGELKIQFRIQRPKDKYDKEKAESFFDGTTWVGLNSLFSLQMDEDKYETYFKDQKDKDRVFYDLYGQQIARRFVERLQFFVIDPQGARVALDLDATLVSKFDNGLPLSVSLRVGGTAFPKRKQIEYLGISTPLDFDMSAALPPGSEVIVRSGSLNYKTKHYAGVLCSQARIDNDLLFADDVLIYAAPSQQELRNPREDDLELSKRLLRHLNSQVEYYHRLLWLGMPAERRFMLLDGVLGPEVANGRSVASLVENKVVAVVGNSLVMPVARGVRLDPTFQGGVLDEEHGEVRSLKSFYEGVPPEPFHISVPTRGVFAEAVIGKCNSCEEKEEHRYWRWEESPIPDSPTPILPVSTDSRRAEPGDLQPKDFPQTVLNIQNAPSAPAPQGAAELARALVAPSPFRDLAGLDGTQRNASTAMTSALSSAENFGRMAADIAEKQAVLNGNNSYLQSLKRAHEDNMITREQMNEQALAYFKRQNGDGAGSAERTPKPQFEESDTFRNVADQASVRGKDIQLEHTSSDGAVTKLKTQSSGQPVSTVYDVQVYPAVTYVPQDSPNTCWAAAATMLKSWKASSTLTTEQVMDLAGPEFRTLFDAKDGLDLSLLEVFFENLAIEYAAPASYPIEMYAKLLKEHGPLWLMLDDNQQPGKVSPHALLVVGVKGDGTPEGTLFDLLDPAAAGEMRLSFAELIQKLEELIELPGNPPTQIAYNRSASATVGSVGPYNRAAAVKYAEVYANRVCSDGYFYLYEKSPPRYMPDQSVNGISSSDDCTHFISCCIGLPPRDTTYKITGGGLFIEAAGLYKTMSPPPYGPASPFALLHYLSLTNKILFLNGDGQLQRELFFHLTDQQAALQLPFDDPRGDVVAFSDANEAKDLKNPVNFRHSGVIVSVDPSTQDKLVACHSISRWSEPIGKISFPYFVYARITR